MIIGVRWAGLSVFETADLLRFSHIIVSLVYPEWYEKQKTGLTELLTNLYNRREQKSIPE